MGLLIATGAFSAMNTSRLTFVIEYTIPRRHQKSQQLNSWLWLCFLLNNLAVLLYLSYLCLDLTLSLVHSLDTFSCH